MNKYELFFVAYLVCFIFTNSYSFKNKSKTHPIYSRAYDINCFKLGKNNKIEAIGFYKTIFGKDKYNEVIDKAIDDFKEKDKVYVFCCSRRKNCKKVKDKLYKKHPIIYSKKSSQKELLKAYVNLLLIQLYILKKEKISGKYSVTIAANRVEVYKRENGEIKKYVEKCKELKTKELFERVKESDDRIKKDFDELLEKEQLCNEFKLARWTLEAMEEEFLAIKEKEKELEKKLQV